MGRKRIITCRTYLLCLRKHLKPSIITNPSILLGLSIGRLVQAQAVEKQSFTLRKMTNTMWILKRSYSASLLREADVTERWRIWALDMQQILR